jgi:hypothetical protein
MKFSYRISLSVQKSTMMTQYHCGFLAKTNTDDPYQCRLVLSLSVLAKKNNSDVLGGTVKTDSDGANNEC